MNPRFEHPQLLTASAGSRVFRAYDRNLQRDIALKRPLPAGDAALQREARALALIHHPGVVALLEAGSDAEGPYLCLEWLEGETLEKRLQQQLSESATQHLLRQVLHALDAVHSAGLAHADVKAENLIVAANGHATLIDFGNATPFQQSASGLVGSIHSMAPELFDQQPPGIASDLYAVGILAYQCLSGQLPFQGETKPQVITAHLRHLRTPLHQVCQVSPALEAWVETLMARAPNQRPASATEALALLPAN